MLIGRDTRASGAALLEAVGEFTDMLLPYPDDYIANAPESAFKPLLESLPVQVLRGYLRAERSPG